MSSSRQKRGTRWQGERKYLWSAIAERTLRIQNDLISNIGEGSAVHFPFNNLDEEEKDMEADDEVCEILKYVTLNWSDIEIYEYNIVPVLLDLPDKKILTAMK